MRTALGKPSSAYARILNLARTKFHTHDNA